MIPKLLHQIWLGPRPAPLVWTGVYRRYLTEGLYDGAADVARIEILHRFGGVYADADSVALRPLGDAPFMDSGSFAALEPNDDHPGLITNAFMGAIRGHDVLSRYADLVSRVETLRPMWRLTGPGALTSVLTSHDRPDVRVLPAWTFFTTALSGETVQGGSSYAQHFWSTTAERWGRGAVTPYPASD